MPCDPVQSGHCPLRAYAYFLLAACLFWCFSPTASVAQAQNITANYMYSCQLGNSTQLDISSFYSRIYQFNLPSTANSENMMLQLFNKDSYNHLILVHFLETGNNTQLVFCDMTDTNYCLVPLPSPRSSNPAYQINVTCQIHCQFSFILNYENENRFVIGSDLEIALSRNLTDSTISQKQQLTLVNKQ